MANLIQIKRNTTWNSDTNPSSLAYGELAWNNQGTKLFIGKQTDSIGTVQPFHLSTLSDVSAGNGIAVSLGSGNDDNSLSVSLNIDNLTALGGTGIAATDYLAFSDAGVEKKITYGNLRDAIYGSVSGDATIAGGGALTIAADSVEGTMLNTNAADGTTMELSTDSLSVLKVPNQLSTGSGLTGSAFDGAIARTFAINPTQTTITDIYNASLQIGNAENDDYINFAEDSEIRLILAGTIKTLVASDTAVTIGDGTADVDFIVDDTSGVAAFTVDAGTGNTTVANDLTVSGGFSVGDVFANNVASNSFHYNNSGTLGAEAFSIGAAGGVTFNAALELDNNLTVTTATGAILKLYTSDTDVDIGDVLGRIDFAAPSETDTGDARQLAASIVAKASAEFTSTANKTDLIFYVGESGVAEEAMKIGWNKKVTILGDLQVDGTTTTVNSTVVTIDDPIFTLGGDGDGLNDTKDRGIEFKWHNGTTPKVGFFGFNEDNGKFTFIPDATNSSEVFSGTAGNVEFGTMTLNNTSGNLDGAYIDGGSY
jgi:hypothetical protein